MINLTLLLSIATLQITNSYIDVRPDVCSWIEGPLGILICTSLFMVYFVFRFTSRRGSNRIFLSLNDTSLEHLSLAFLSQLNGIQAQIVFAPIMLGTKDFSSLTQLKLL